jgi:hypothetical protein
MKPVCKVGDIAIVLPGVLSAFRGLMLEDVVMEAEDQIKQLVGTEVLVERQCFCGGGDPLAWVCATKYAPVPLHCDDTYLLPVRPGKPDEVEAYRLELSNEQLAHMVREASKKLEAERADPLKDFR